MRGKTIAFESLTVSSVSRAYREIVDAFGSGAGVDISLTGLRSIDLAGVQLLVAAFKLAAASGVTIGLSGEPSEAIRDRLTMIGLCESPPGCAAEIADAFRAC